MLSRSALFWHFPGYLDGPVIRGREGEVELGFRTRPVSVIRKGDWKLHLFHEEWVLDGGRQALPGNGAVELYHVTDDPGERNDLAARKMHQVNALLDELLAWMEKTPGPHAAGAEPRFRSANPKQPAVTPAPLIEP